MATAKLQLTALPRHPDGAAGRRPRTAHHGRHRARASIILVPQDVLVVAQKVVSKAEGRVLPLDTVRPRPDARDWAEKTGKDPRLVELILTESKGVSCVIARAS